VDDRAGFVLSTSRLFVRSTEKSHRPSSSPRRVRQAHGGRAHGDTPPSAAGNRPHSPPDILITTPDDCRRSSPEGDQRHLRSVQYVIIDEVHQFAVTAADSARGRPPASSVASRTRFQRIACRNCRSSGRTSPPCSAGRTAPDSRRASSRSDTISGRVRSDRARTSRPPGTSTSPPRRLAGLSALDDSLDESGRPRLCERTAARELLGSRLSMVRQDVAVHHGSLPREEREPSRRASKPATSKVSCRLRP